MVKREGLQLNFLVNGRERSNCCFQFYHNEAGDNFADSFGIYCVHTKITRWGDSVKWSELNSRYLIIYALTDLLEVSVVDQIT